MKKLIKFWKDEEGATVPEYAIMVALIAVVVIAAVTLLGNKASETFQAVAGQLPGGS